MKKITVLGSTGSIGTQTLDVVRNLEYKVVALAAGNNIDVLEMQAREFKPSFIAVADREAAKELKIRLSDTSIKIESGDSAVIKAASKKCDIVVNAVTGIKGLAPTLAAIEAKNNIALANKETLVAGGRRVMDYAAKKGIKILPVDSEHSAIFQCLKTDDDYDRIGRLILTASGGPFFGKNKTDLENITPLQALQHPTWSMGKKVSIDSASMVNKGLEIIEASNLFNIEENRIDVLIHRESIVHSLVEFKDNSVIAQLGVPDMRTPIQYALTYPERCNGCANKLDLAEICELHFYNVDDCTFPAIDLAREALRMGGTATAAFNAADEVAVKYFLEEKIGFNEIPNIIEKTINQKFTDGDSFEDVFYTDLTAREYAESLI